MAFDPDEYLNETGSPSTATTEFDPDAYLSELDSEEETEFNPDTYLEEQPTVAGFRIPKAPPIVERPPVVESVGQLQGIANAAMNAFDASRQSMAVAGGVSPEEAEEISRLEYQKEARKIAPAYQEYLDAGGMDAVKAFARNPLEITTNIVAEGLAGSLYSLGAGLVAGGTAAGAAAVTGVGAPLAPAAFLGGQIGGTFAGSLATEYGSKVLEELQNAGMDIKDPESIQKFFSDEKLVDEARTQGLKRGIPVAIFDGFSAGIAGRLARAPIAQVLKKTPTRLAVTEATAQAGAGGLGEISGAVAAGEEIQPKAVFAEVLGEAGPAAAEITVGRIATRLAKTPEEKQFDQNILAAQVATRATQDVAPATADALERQVQDTISETAETPEQRVARLQEEATAAAGIELEEEPPVSGLPPERIKSARWFESASRNRLKELQDKDEAGVEDFTTQETEEYAFLQSNPTPEQIAERYGYQVRTDVEPTTVTPKEPAAAPTPAESLLTRKSELDAEAKRLGADNISSFNSMYATRESLTEEQRNLLNQYGEYNKQVVELGWRDAAKLDDADFGRWEKIKLTTKPVSDQELTDLGKLYLAFNERGETQKAESVLKSIQSGKRKTNNTIEGWFKATDETLNQEEIDTINRENQDWNDSVDAMTEILGRKTPPEEISPADIAPTLTPTPVTPVAPTPEGVSPTPETPNLEPLRRVARAEQTEEDVSGLVGQGLVELYNGQPVITQAGLEALPEAERPRLNPEARKIQIDTGSNEVVAEAIAKNLRIGVDQVGTGVRMPAGWTLVEDIYVPPKPIERIAPSDVETLAEVDEDSDVFAEVIRKKDETKTAVVQKPEGSKFSNQEEFRAAFDLRGEGHGRFATRLDLMVADGAITSEGRDLVMAVIFDNNTNDKFLNNMEMGSMRPRVTRAYGRGGVSRQTVQSAKGRAIGYKPSLIMMQNARKELNIDERTAQTLSTFWHEFGHAGYYSLLDKAQKDKIASIYRKTTKAKKEEFFASGVAAARQEDVTARYYAKSEAEWFAQSLAEYVLTKKSDQKQLVPIFNNILNKIKNIFGKLFSRKEGTPELEDIFEYIIQGKDYGSTKIWWNGMQMSLSPAIYGVKGAQPVDPAFSRKLVEREKQNRARSRTAPEAAEIREEPEITGEAPPTAADIIPETVPTFSEGSPEAATLTNMKESMAKVDAASEGKPNPENKPTYKISEIASVWMDQGGDARQLQDMVVEYTNLTPANAKKVANAIAKQYGLQQRIAETGAVIAEPAAEVSGAPRKTSVQRLIEQAVGVRRPIVKLEVNEKTALKDQIRLKAREARETRKARKEAARELAEAVTQYVKDNQIRGPVRARQTISLAKQALKLDVNNEKAVDRYIMYVERVVENANYDKDLSDAKALRKRAKQIAKNKNIGPEQKKVLEAIGNINPSLLDNPYEYNVLTERYLLGFLPVTSARYSVMPDAEARQYLESLEEQMKRNQAELDRAELERFFEARVDFAQQRGLSMEDAESLLNEDGDIAPIIQDYDLEKRKATEEMLLNLAQNAQKTLKTYDDTANTARQKELISFMQKVKLESITPDEKKRFIRFANNVLANGETFGVEQFEAIAKAQMASVEAAKDKRLSKKFAAWISPIAGETATEAAKGLAQYTQSEADTLKNIFGREAVGAFRKLLGLLELDRKQTLATKVKEQIANKVGQFYENLKKKYGEDAVNMEAKTYAAAAGYFIQAEGNKTQEESIAYRRRLWQENIEDLRQSERKSDRDEAELKQKALEALTGNSNAEILNSLKSLNPASYEQLMWWKDEMHPEHKEFLKEHNENFRNQADNYSENDYLSIHYKWKEYVETPSELDAQEYEDPISFRIRQSANSIKRKEHANLPVNPKTNTKANIDVNFGYNQYSALTDQIDRAYTAPAWESVWAFTRVPEFETIVGGRANANFVKNILRNIKATRSKRAMLDDENQIIGGNVALARRLATQATLGGATQPIRQVPDQLFKLFSTSGRWDIIASNIANSVINYSGVVTNNPLLDKFPISRRGDARAGSQFAAEFNELARKVEASATNKKWAKYKELMNKMGEFWMTPLRASDAWIAKVSWLSYYEAYLNRNNIKMESFEREAELAETDQVRQEAAAQAEYMVDFYAGASDPTKMAALSKQSNNGWREFAKLVFLPLNSFALQQKSALISDARDLMLREGDRKAALAGIVGNVAGMVAFHGIRIYLIGGLIYPAGMAVLKGIFGIDMDEPDEEEQDKRVRDNWRKMKASIYANIVAGGAGQFFEGLSIDAFNKTMYLWDAQINPDEILNKDGEVMSFGQYEKEMSPFYRYRSYASPEYTFGLVDVLTEQAQRSVTQTGQLLSDEEMSAYTPNEQAYAYFSTTVEWLYFFKMMDTDATRVARRLKQDMDRQVKEREAELARIRSGR